MSALESLDINLEGIAHALSDNQLIVPMYQRSYAWKAEQVRELFQDIGSAIRDRQEEYFLGSVVLTRKSRNLLEVVDGQQRLATISIFIAAIRDYFSAKNDDDRANEIEKNYLFNRNLRTQELNPRLSLNQVDHDFYAKRILSRATHPDRAVPSTRESHSRLVEAQKIAQETIHSITGLVNAPDDALFDWLDFIDKQAKVIWVKVPDESNAFTIFETLNDRGLDLAVSDLLKNYLFSLAGDRLAEVQSKWLAIVGLMESVESESIVISYIRHFWSAKNGLTREKELYTSIKSKIRSKQAAIDFVGELEANAKIYTALLNPQHETWAKYGASARHAIETFLLFRIEQNRPLLLALTSKFAPPELVEAFRLLVALSVRHAITGKAGSGSPELGYSDAAKNIMTGTIANAKTLCAALETFNPSDEEFKTGFSLATVTKGPIARYYLRAIERQLMNEAEPELVPNTNQEELTLEHILPQNPSSDWLMSADQMKKLYKRIGNLTLLSAGANVTAENASFATKLPIYRGSKLKITAELGNYSEWGAAQIEQRQNGLTAIAQEIWKLKS